jgi:hypothetical protein
VYTIPRPVLAVLLVPPLSVTCGEIHICSRITSSKDMNINKYLTYRLVSEGSGGGNPTPET